ncbi:MAG: M20/M25/M40 family metallo-hydrolase [Actinomycetota bacterium]
MEASAAPPPPGDAESTLPRIIELLGEVVAIPSVNPMQTGPRSGPGGEEAMAHWVADTATGLGAEVTLDEVEAGRPNVYAAFDGGFDTTTAVDIHLDTVGVEHMTDEPFDGRHEDGRVYGRGSVDTKATLAVLVALLEQEAAALATNLALVGTVSEEAGGLLGAYRLRDWADERSLRFDRMIVAEPTSCIPVHGHKGGVGLEITVLGEAAHSSTPEEGTNAIEAAARIVAAFVEEQERLRRAEPSTPVGTGTLSVTEIEGGLARNIIPDRCRLYAGRRIAPGEDPATEFDRLRAMAVAAAAPVEIEVTMTYGRGSPAFYESPDSELVTLLASLGGAPPATAGYGSNALVYPPIAAETVVFGPGSIDQAHKAVEWVETAELARAAGVYREVLTS